MMDSMYVLTVKRDGGTQDVVGFYSEQDLGFAIHAGKRFLEESRDSRRAIIRLEYYNPSAKPPPKPANQPAASQRTLC